MSLLGPAETAIYTIVFTQNKIDTGSFCARMFGTVSRSFETNRVFVSLSPFFVAFARIHNARCLCMFTSTTQLVEYDLARLSQLKPLLVTYSMEKNLKTMGLFADHPEVKARNFN